MASEKPESVTLPGFPWRSEIRYAEISHMGKMIGCRCRVNDRPEARVLVVGFGPTTDPGRKPGDHGKWTGWMGGRRVDGTARIRQLAP